MKTIVSGFSQIPLGYVNAFLLESDAGLTVIDTGVPGSENKILAAVAEIGKAPEDITSILVTHLHNDHTGSLSALKQRTGASAYMHEEDAEMIRQGNTMRPLATGPGILRRIVAGLVGLRAPGIEPIEIEHELSDGQILEFAGGAKVFHAPGHAAGQVAFLLPSGVLIAADSASNFLRLSWPPIFEDVDAGRNSLRKLSALEFDVAVFGHGKAIMSQAAQRFREKWGD